MTTEQQNNSASEVFSIGLPCLGVSAAVLWYLEGLSQLSQKKSLRHNHNFTAASIAMTVTQLSTTQDKIVQVLWNGFPLLMAVLATILCLVPFTVDPSYSEEGHRDTSTWSNLHSSVYRDSLVASVALCVPILIDLLLDTWCYRKFDPVWLTQWVLIVAVLAPNLYIFCEVQASLHNLVSFYWAISKIQLIVLVNALLFYLTNVEDGFTRTVCHNAMSLLATTMGIVHVYSQNTLCATTSLQVLFVVLFALTMLMCSWLTYKWVRRYMTDIDTDTITPDQFCGVFFTLSLQFVMVAYLLFLLSYNSTDFSDLTTGYLAGSNYVASLFAISLTVVHGRKVRLAVAVSEVSRSTAKVVVIIFFTAELIRIN